MPRRLQLALRPQHHLLVSNLSGEAYALRHQASTNAQTACRGFYQQQAELRNRSRFLHQEDGSYDLAILLRDPAALPLRNEILDELGGDFCDQRLEALVIPVFLRIEDAMPMHHPTHVAGLMRPQEIRVLAAVRASSISEEVL